ncbi:MAG: DUF1801 domain-containing protein [Saprospiraceae bacterium]
MREKIKTLSELYDILPENELVITDILRQIIIENLPPYGKEKISYQVPFFYGNKGISIIWPATIPRGGIKEGVLLGFWYGNKLQSLQNYLIKGTNKQIFCKVIKHTEEIDEKIIKALLSDALQIDKSWVG